MEKKTKTKIFGIAIAFCLVVVFGAAATVTASNQNIVVTWIVPGDTSFSYDLAGAETEIVFDCDGMNFSDVAMRSQASGTPGLTITNGGNKALQINMTFSSTWYDEGIDFFNVSVDTNDNTTAFWWTNANETNNQTVVESLPISDSEDFWFWSTGTEVSETGESADEEMFEIWGT